jgi:hypothetical protein
MCSEHRINDSGLSLPHQHHLHKLALFSSHFLFCYNCCNIRGNPLLTQDYPCSMLGVSTLPPLSETLLHCLFLYLSILKFLLTLKPPPQKHNFINSLRNLLNYLITIL